MKKKLLILSLVITFILSTASSSFAASNSAKYSSSGPWSRAWSVTPAYKSGEYHQTFGYNTAWVNEDYVNYYHCTRTHRGSIVQVNYWTGSQERHPGSWVFLERQHVTSTVTYTFTSYY